MRLSSHRARYFFGFIAIVLLLAGSLYLEYFKGVMPCPLCILQRIDMIVLGILFLIGAAFRLRSCGQIILSSLTGLISLAGIAFAGRQVWLQHHPIDNNADCGVSLSYLMHALPMDQVVTKVLSGTAECAQTGWQFISLSLAEWSLIWFVLFLIFSMTQLKK